MMSNHDVTKAVSDYVRSKGILITVLSEGTGISYNVLQPSIMGKRKVTRWTFLKCTGTVPGKTRNKELLSARNSWMS